MAILGQPFEYTPAIGEKPANKTSMKDCPHREIREKMAECKCGMYSQLFCNKLNLPVGQAGCIKCQEDPKWILKQQQGA